MVNVTASRIGFGPTGMVADDDTSSNYCAQGCHARHLAYCALALCSHALSVGIPALCGAANVHQNGVAATRRLADRVVGNNGFFSSSSAEWVRVRAPDRAQRFTWDRRALASRHAQIGRAHV